MRPTLAFVTLVTILRSASGAACPPVPGPLEPDRGWVADLLDPTCDLGLLGAQERAFLGGQHLLVGDLDGDGRQDLVTTAVAGDSPLRMGYVEDVLVLFGPRLMPDRQDLAIRPADLTIRGGLLWAKPLAMGDLTGDGLDDLVLAHGLGTDACWREVIVLAGPLAPGALDAASLVPFARLRTERPCPSGQAGFWEGLVADVTADGLPDLVVTVGGYSHPSRPWGTSDLRIVAGPIAAGAVIDVDSPSVAQVLGEPPVVVPLDTSPTSFGMSLAAADVSGDGVADIIAGAAAQRDAGGTRRHPGVVHVLFGPIVPASTRDLAVAPAEVRILGHDQSVLGDRVAVADMTGDGLPDVVASAFNERSFAGTLGAGAIHVVRAPLAPGLIDLASTPAHAVIRGPHGSEAWTSFVGSQLGRSLAVGDVDGDGAPDLVAPAHIASLPDGTRPESGRAFVVRGPLAAGTEVDLACENVTLVEVRAARDRDALGEQAAIADMNGDGVGDVILSAPIASGGDGTRPAAGEIHVIDATNSLPEASHGGPYAAECTGAVVSLRLDSTASLDADGDPLRRHWATDCPRGSIDDEAGAAPVLTIEPEDPTCDLTCRVAVTVTDCLGAYERTMTTVTIRDTTAPGIAPSAGEVALWPPSHRFRRIETSDVAVLVQDACGGDVTWRFESCASSEPEDARGDGRTLRDCLVVDGGAALLVRSERSGPGAGRGYDVTVVASDACGNETPPTPAVRLVVPHDRRRR